MGPSFTESSFYRSGRSICWPVAGVGWMLGVAGEEIKGVGQEWEDGMERVFGSAWVAGKVEDEGATRDSADSAA